MEIPQSVVWEKVSSHMSCLVEIIKISRYIIQTNVIGQLCGGSWKCRATAFKFLPWKPHAYSTQAVYVKNHALLTNRIFDRERFIPFLKDLLASTSREFRAKTSYCAVPSETDKVLRRFHRKHVIERNYLITCTNHLRIIDEGFKLVYLHEDTTCMQKTRI